MTAPAAIEVIGATRRFGRRNAVEDVSFTVPENSVTGLLGRNGAGKTTIMSLVSGQDRPTSGEVRVFGEQPFENGRILSSMSFVRDNQRYPEDYYLRHVLDVAPRFHERWDAELAARLVDGFRLPAKPVVKKYSRGQLSALGIVLGLASRAPITIFDEPYLGLDATARAMFYDALLQDYAEHPRAVLLSTHLIDEMESLLERVVIVDKGRLIREDSTEDLAGAAFTISGIAAAVTGFVDGRRVLREHRVGGLLSLTVEGALSPAEKAEARDAGLDLAPARLQELVAAYGADLANENEGARA
ncbi:ABC transporter ATP-binding protein [Naasia sp. SYSU D00057]|uniref:ABC transporter ATP-binding protein n=1 Tax=Naasia sp. SYSU D00057 TaxID=2817380 RepID=UPI001B31699F|nr:ABC transporter ATP-binding protein [Naasia sp. SYSU D00057]